MEIKNYSLLGVDLHRTKGDVKQLLVFVLLLWKHGRAVVVAMEEVEITFFFTSEQPINNVVAT